MGWAPQALASATGANMTGVRNPYAVLAARLSPDDLPVPASVRSVRRVRSGHADAGLPRRYAATMSTVQGTVAWHASATERRFARFQGLRSATQHRPRAYLHLGTREVLVRESLGRRLPGDMNRSPISFSRPMTLAGRARFSIMACRAVSLARGEDPPRRAAVPRRWSLRGATGIWQKPAAGLRSRCLQPHPRSAPATRPRPGAAVSAVSPVPGTGWNDQCPGAGQSRSRFAAVAAGAGDSQDVIVDGGRAAAAAPGPGRSAGRRGCVRGSGRVPWGICKNRAPQCQIRDHVTGGAACPG